MEGHIPATRTKHIGINNPIEQFQDVNPPPTDKADDDDAR